MLLAVQLLHSLLGHPLPFNFLGLLLHSLTHDHDALDELVLQGKGGEIEQSLFEICKIGNNNWQLDFKFYWAYLLFNLWFRVRGCWVCHWKK